MRCVSRQGTRVWAVQGGVMLISRWGSTVSGQEQEVAWRDEVCEETRHAGVGCAEGCRVAQQVG